MVRVLKTQMHTTVIVLLAGPEINVKQKYVIRTHATGMEDAVLFITLWNVVVLSGLLEAVVSQKIIVSHYRVKIREYVPAL